MAIKRQLIVSVTVKHNTYQDAFCSKLSKDNWSTSCFLLWIWILENKDVRLYLLQF